jgi:hypothetical protein
MKPRARSVYFSKFMSFSPKRAVVARSACYPYAPPITPALSNIKPAPRNRPRRTPCGI